MLIQTRIDLNPDLTRLYEATVLYVMRQLTLAAINEFGANPYTEEEERPLPEIIDAFNERHGTNFTREDFLRFQRVNREILDDEMFDMMRKNPADVVYNAFSQAFFQGMIRML